MHKPFREHHLFELLKIYDKETLPLDVVIHRYFQAHKALGSKDRAFVAETAYELMRWKGFLEALEPGVDSLSWEKKYTIYQQIDVTQSLEDENFPIHIRLSVPSFLYDLLKKAYGEKKAIEICLENNHSAPTTIRVNPLKTTRESLFSKWEKAEYDIALCKDSPWGIVFNKKIALFSLPEFKQGDFEVQDEGSQLLAMMIQAQPGDLVMDYCAGSGGKTLAFAPQMKNKGQIYLHDIRPEALDEARKRLKRAGVQNGQIALAGDPKLKKLKKKMDWVLVDAPCSGTGTLRRNPDMKWKLEPETITRLVGQQRTIFERALSFLKPGGKIVYATCSLLEEENDQQVEHFLKTYPLKLASPVFRSFPTRGGMDGFFGASLTLSASP